MKVSNQFTRAFNLDIPLVMAPMFLVSNEKMMIAGIDSGVLPAFPSLNYRKEGELEHVLATINEHIKNKGQGCYAVNLIVQKSNPLYEQHLELCVKHKVPVYITSLGNPGKVIEKAHDYGAKVFCDVTNLEHAEKAFSLGCDGFIAVGQGAGGHAGPFPLHLLVPALRRKFPDKIVIAAGGIATGEAITSMLCLGADAVSVGTRFIASEEASVNSAYKEAVVNSKMNDIVLTSKISGTPCTIINTPDAKKMGYRQNFIERFLSNNPRTKKWFKMLVQLRGFKSLERSVLPANYSTLWCAGQSVELINEIDSCKSIVERLKSETIDSLKKSQQWISEAK